MATVIKTPPTPLINFQAGADLRAKIKSLDEGNACNYPTFNIYTQGGSDTGTLLVSLTMSTPAFSLVTHEEGYYQASANPIQPGRLVASGRASVFELVSKNMQRLIGGTIGPPGSRANLELEKVDLSKGSVLTISGFKLFTPG